MKRIGILSDTHSYWDQRFMKYFSNCDYIFHCGDIGTLSVTEQLARIAPLYAVYGNIDAQDVREVYPEVLFVRIENVDILMTHIGGYPGRYDPKVKKLIQEKKPKLFLTGHSHILKVMPDPMFDLLHINPGAAGIHGWHTRRTLVRLEINGESFQNLEVIELSE
ncbi:metallophosphoesterase family protein [Porphyromonas circumdentaria]|uniref:metallophosphoesterase family protein n=1 Tax=Porphyromonas circumdentaria TaxID=29524 RepID=UPI0026DB5926|nr:metallophosphoesterase family protein [Porphyromonas circumdentaria]MDO4723079.1 metallophosphoesterase family protein [Porphyromonas circumdentaria]